jgi:hypothetical protein
VTGIFEYLNNVSKIHLLKSKATTAEDFCNITHVEEALKAISLFTIESTMKKLNSSKVSKTETMNMVYATDIVRMALLHIKCTNI